MVVHGSMALFWNMDSDSEDRFYREHLPMPFPHFPVLAEAERPEEESP